MLRRAPLRVVPARALTGAMPGDLVAFQTKGVFALLIRTGQRIMALGLLAFVLEALRALVRGWDPALDWCRYTHIGNVVQVEPTIQIVQSVRRVNQVALATYGDTPTVLCRSPRGPLDSRRVDGVDFVKGELNRLYGVLSVISRGLNCLTPKWLQIGASRGGDMDCSTLGARNLEHQGIAIPWRDPWQVTPGQIVFVYGEDDPAAERSAMSLFRLPSRKTVFSIAWKVAAAFGAAFLASLLAHVSGVHSLSTIRDAIVGGAGAGVTAVQQLVAGLIRRKAAALHVAFRYRTGRRPAVFPVGLHLFRHYLRGTTFPGAASALLPPSGVAWGMDLNDQLGCCTIAGVDHGIAACNAVFGEDDPRPSMDALRALYLSLSPDDTGCVESEVLELWRTKGLFGNKITAYAPLDHTNLTELCQAIDALGWAYLGINCPATAQQQFAQQEQSGDLVPWTYEGAPAPDGHCIIAVGYTALPGAAAPGGQPAGLWCVSWGTLVLVTYDFLAAYLEEAWGVVTQELAEKGADALGIDVAPLVADLSAASAN